MDPEHPNASDMLLSKLTRFSLQGAGISHAGYSCSSRARASVRSIGKIKRFLMRHEVDRVDVGHILAPARPFRLRDLQVYLLSGGKVDSSGFVGIKPQAGDGNNVMPGRNVAVETAAHLLVPDLNAVQRYPVYMGIVIGGAGCEPV